MRKLNAWLLPILTACACFSASIVVFAEEPLPLDTWASSQSNALTADCARITHAEWVKRYNRMSIAVMEEMKTVDVDTFKEHDPDGSLRQFIETVFPQHFPEGKRNRNTNICFADLWKFTKSVSSADRKESMGSFETCTREHYRPGLPKPVARLIDCWKRLKP